MLIEVWTEKGELQCGCPHKTIDLDTLSVFFFQVRQPPCVDYDNASLQLQHGKKIYLLKKLIILLNSKKI